MKNMKKPYLVVTAEKAWSKPASEEVYAAVPGNKEMVAIPEAGHFDMYDLDPYVTEACEHIIPFFEKQIGKVEG